MKAWKVSHVFAAPVAYQSGPLSYPRLGITLAGDRSAITGIDHELDVDDQLSKPEVVGLSTLEVSLLVEVVRYRTGYCDILSRTPSLRAPLPGESVSTTTFTYQTGRAAIQRAADFPVEANLPSAPPRLRVWLRLAADASEMSPPDAIRNYYMVGGHGPSFTDWERWRRAKVHQRFRQPRWAAHKSSFTRIPEPRASQAHRSVRST